MKPIPILQITTLDCIDELLTSFGPKFELLLAIAGRQYSDAEILRAAAKCVALGLTFICTWGPDCERVHDLFDQIDVERSLDAGTTYPLIMSTWQSKDTIEEAFDFLRDCAWPHEDNGEYGRNPVVLVERLEWQVTLKRYQGQ